MSEFETCLTDTVLQVKQFGDVISCVVFRFLLIISGLNVGHQPPQSAFTPSKLRIERLEQDMKYVQSQQKTTEQHIIIIHSIPLSMVIPGSSPSHYIWRQKFRNWESFQKQIFQKLLFMPNKQGVRIIQECDK